MINAGIVGLGWWGKNLVEAVQNRSDRLRFVRGACRDTAPVAAFAERHGLALSTSLAEVLADDRVQAVVLATPHSLHADQIVAVAQAGKPVLCEKPLALTRADAARAIDACQRAGVVLGWARITGSGPTCRRCTASSRRASWASRCTSKAIPATRMPGSTSVPGAILLPNRRLAA